jgi:hypothetical protein
VSRTALIAIVVALVAASGFSRAQQPARASAQDHPVLAAAGDVARCTAGGDEATAALLEGADTVAMLGDGVYPDASQAGYEQCYGPSWGAYKERTRPVLGNHDYDDPGAAGYFAYFGPAAGDQGKGYYSYDLGDWHIVALNSNCPEVGGCGPTGHMQQWLRADLAANTKRCIMAYWHHPRFYSGLVSNLEGSYAPSDDRRMARIWADLQEAGASLVLSAHMHVYERFARMDAGGSLDPSGMRQFVVGTGGGPRHAIDPNKVAPNSEARGDHVYGVLRLTLGHDGYDWEFRSGQAFTDSGHDTCGRAGESPSTTTTTTTTAVEEPSHHAASDRSGYWMVGSDGRVYAFGAARKLGDAALDAVDLEPTPSGNGYWVVDSAGRVSAFGNARWMGNAGVAERVTSLSSTNTGDGYWIFTAGGRVLPFGDAIHYGDMAATRLNGPVLDSIPTASGKGYYMVASDGGIFSFGDAKFYGSMGGKRLNAPVQSLVPDGDGTGYWLVSSDGGIFAFDAPFRGSMGGTRLNKPVTGMVRFGNGYLMVGEDGGVFNFSDKPFHGSLGNNPPARPIVSVAASE